MKIILSTIGSLFLMIAVHLAAAQPSLEGSWKMVSTHGQPVTDVNVVAICQDGYFMFGQYRLDGSFMSAGGGNYQLNGDQFQITYDFNTENS